jgi:hypothetical protein
MRKRTSLLSLSLSLALLLSFGCAETSASDEACTGDEDNEYCKPLLETTPEDGKADSTAGLTGPSVSADSSDTVAWEVSNQWEDTNTSAARAAGMAWGEDSGLDWNEKFGLWIEAMPRIAGHDTYYETFELSTPWGKTLPAPSLECAETALFLRATFASWYNLPFYIEAYDPSVGRIYFGHFGIRTKTGRWGNMPRFKSAYTDYTNRYDGTNWPSDAKLRGRKLAKSGDDENGFLGEELYAGAYFDEIFLNKRAGHFMHYLLIFTGSMHLASSDNTFNLKAEAVQQGDVLLERWQRRGIGHTLVVKHVEDLGNGRIDAELVSGSMPRRQPKWESAAASKRTFINDYCGGVGENDDGEAYAALGGGIKRFRVAKVMNGKYRNQIPTKDQGVWINDTDLEAIAARIATFDEILGDLTPAEKRDALVALIEDKRMHLRDHPSSCSARIGREDAFTELYELMEAEYGWARARVDGAYRKVEDYVLAEMVYDLSKVCCWNSSTHAMYEIIMDYNDKLAYDEESQTCTDVTVFKNRDDGADGFSLFREHAEAMGRGDQWVTWSADETCPQAEHAESTEEVHGWTPQCDIIETMLANASLTGCVDAYAGNVDAEHAATVAPGTYVLAVCPGEEDWFKLETGGLAHKISIDFSHAAGDLELQTRELDETAIDSSTTSSDHEEVKVDGGLDAVLVRVYGHSAAENRYTLNISVVE